MSESEPVTQTKTRRTAWRRIARRIRVPLGFVFAGVFLWLARPTWESMLASLLLVVPGLWLRGYAAGYVRKNAELTTTGPYAYTRNPLYLGSMMIAFGFAAASGRWFIVVALAALFLAIYLPTIFSEEEFLRAQFAGFDAYAAKVPRLLPRLTAAKTGVKAEVKTSGSAGVFSKQLYLHHREYNSAMGAVAIYAALAARLWFPAFAFVDPDTLNVQIHPASADSLKRIESVLSFAIVVAPLVIVLAGACGTAAAQYTPIPVLQPPVSSFTFPPKQTLTFDVDWRVFTAGTAVFHLERQGTVQKISATADTIGGTNLLFPVVDKFQSGFDTKTGCSTGFNKQLQEGSRKVNSELSFNYNTGKQTQYEKNMVKGTSKTLTASIPACVTDSLSAIFYAASQPLVIGQNVRFPLADSMRTVTVVMKVEGKEEIKTPAGTFETIRVQPTAEEGIVKNRGNIWIWYTDDARHIPVQMRARLFWGTITFHLKSIEAK